MNGIDTRAQTYALGKALKAAEDMEVVHFDKDDLEEAYVKGAAEQMAIDNEKACEWMKKLIWWSPFLEEGFRKAMEGDGGQ